MALVALASIGVERPCRVDQASSGIYRPIIKNHGIQEGASLAGNDSSPAS
jgi:hypothetical protein